MLDKDEVNRLFMKYNHKGFSGILEEFQQKDKMIEILNTLVTDAKKRFTEIVDGSSDKIDVAISRDWIKRLEDSTQKENKE